MGSKILRYAGCIAATVVVIALAIYYYRHDPSSGGLPCVFKTLTGYDCPGCGAQRALHAALHGRFAEALSFNPLIFFIAPAAIYLIVVEALRNSRPALYARSMHPAVPVIIFIVVTAFWIGRNL